MYIIYRNNSYSIKYHSLLKFLKNPSLSISSFSSNRIFAMKFKNNIYAFIRTKSRPTLHKRKKKGKKR